MGEWDIGFTGADCRKNTTRGGLFTWLLPDVGRIRILEIRPYQKYRRFHWIQSNAGETRREFFHRRRPGVHADSLYELERAIAVSRIENAIFLAPEEPNPLMFSCFVWREYGSNFDMRRISNEIRIPRNNTFVFILKPLVINTTYHSRRRVQIIDRYAVTTPVSTNNWRN